MNYAIMLLDILIPPTCPVCGEPIRFENRFSRYQGLGDESALIHKKCRKVLRRNDTNFCRRCGTPVKEGIALCERCADGKRSFEEGRSLYIYEGAAKKAMMDIKYHSIREYCEYFAFAANEMYGQWIREKNIAVLIPVPVHPKRRKERGYNQAEELAKHLSAYTGIPMRTDVLIRVQNTKAQKNLGPEERRMNLLHAFDAKTSLPPGSAALLVDDIYTTGATMDTCAWTLKMKGGAASVYCLSMCAAEYL